MSTVEVRLGAIKDPRFDAVFAQAGRTVDGFGQKATGQTRKSQQGFRDLADDIGIIPGRLNATATPMTALGLGAVFAVAKFTEFDVAMDAVAASTHETTENMDALTAAALEAGSTTKYSASEAAGGIDALAKAGVSTTDILAGGLDGALALSAAGMDDVAASAEIAASTMSQFGLEGKDIPHIADLLAAAAGKAQGSVADMGQALNQTGLVAGQMGLSVEETTGTLAAFASAGLIGSDAGTSFRTMLLRLANPSGEAADEMKRLGIEAYDAGGNFVGTIALAGQLQSALAGKEQAERDAALATIFGSDAIRAANVLYAQGAKGIADWTSKVDDAGFAAETAAIKMDNLKGDIEELVGALEVLAIGTGESADGPLRSLVQVLTAITSGLNEMNAEAEKNNVPKLTSSIIDQTKTFFDLATNPPDWWPGGESATEDLTAAIDDSARASYEARYASTDLSSAVAETAEEQRAATIATQEQADMLNELNDAYYDAIDAALAFSDAEIAYAQSVADVGERVEKRAELTKEITAAEKELARADSPEAKKRVREELERLNDELDTYIKGLDLSTEAGRENQESINRQIGAAKKRIEALIEDETATNGAVIAQEKAAVAADQMADELYDSAIAMGATKAEARDLADKIRAIPKTAKTDVKVDTSTARARIDALMAAIAAIKGKRVTIEVNEFHRLLRSQDVLDNEPGRRAQGGGIFGPGSGTSDSVPILASNGEHMWTAQETQAVGGHGAMLELRRRARSGVLHLAQGGPVTLDSTIRLPAGGQDYRTSFSGRPSAQGGPVVNMVGYPKEVRRDVVTGLQEARYRGLGA
jgi:TP901 family phage tail tape measure protein